MPNKNIFCNIPWYEIHINHDGSYDLCGCMTELITETDQGQEWNIRKYSVDDYWNSRRLRDERLQKMSDTPNPACGICQHQDSIGSHSKRIKENLKSVLFYDNNFNKSFEQSPHRTIFEHSLNNDGETTTRPVSYHLSLGNECDLACVMCSPYSSFKLAQDYKALGWIQDARRLNWTDDPAIWNQMCETLLATDLVNLHIIGGEPTINKRFHQLIDTLVAAGHTDYSFSFTTNGMHDLTALWPKLEKFKRAEVSFSIETLSKTNDYIRYGSTFETLIDNIAQARRDAPPNVDFVIRTVPTFLTITEYVDVIEWCAAQGLVVDSYFATDPVWQQIKILPELIKQVLRKDFEQLLVKLNRLKQNRPAGMTNWRNPAYALENCIKETESSIASLQPTEDYVELRREAARRLRELDTRRGTDITREFPILRDFLIEYGY
jgi:MoaA/NifB/PqqE/SkfB family radical SAM enzyme